MVNFDRFLLEIDRYEKQGNIHDIIWAIHGMMNSRPNALRKSVAVQDALMQMSWIKDPDKFIQHISDRRPKSLEDKDMYNRRALALLGEFVEDDDFWYPICLKYPEYLKYYKKASDVFKTAIRLVA